MTDKQFESLPQYARTHIEKLQADLRFERSRMERLVSAPEASDIRLDPYSLNTPLPHVAIEYRTKGGPIQTSMYSDGARVTVRGAGGGRIFVLPVAANVVEITTERL